MSLRHLCTVAMDLIWVWNTRPWTWGGGDALSAIYSDLRMKSWWLGTNVYQFWNVERKELVRLKCAEKWRPTAPVISHNKKFGYWNLPLLEFYSRSLRVILWNNLWKLNLEPPVESRMPKENSSVWSESGVKWRSNGPVILNTVTENCLCLNSFTQSLNWLDQYAHFESPSEKLMQFLCLKNSTMEMTQQFLLTKWTTIFSLADRQVCSKS